MQAEAADTFFEALSAHFEPCVGADTRFGVFFLHRHNAYHGRNPRTLERVDVAAKVIPQFFPADAFVANVIDKETERLPSAFLRDAFRYEDTNELIEIPPLVPLEISNEFYEDVVRELCASGQITLSHWGEFSTYATPRRDGLAANTVRFKASQVWKMRLNPRL